MRVRTTLAFLLVVAGATALAQVEAPRAPFSRDRYRIAHKTFTLDNGLTPHRARGPLGAGRRA